MMANPIIYRLVSRQTLVAEDDLEALRRLEPDQLRVETVFSAISPGTELAAYNGFTPLRPTANIYPRLMGYCNVGRVLECGAATEGFSQGDLVLTHSAHRTIDVVPVGEVLCRVPQGASLVDVSTTYLFHLGYSACLSGGVKISDRVAIVGLGTLGLTSAAMASLCGAVVSGFSDHADEALAADFGVRHIHGKSEDSANHDSGFDVVISTSNSWNDWKLALRLARPGGVIVAIGFPGRGEGQPDFNPLDSQYFYDKQLTLKACGHMPDLDADRQDVRFTLKRNCAFLMDSIIAQKIPAGRLIEAVHPADQLADLYGEMTANRQSAKTIVLDWGTDDRDG